MNFLFKRIAVKVGSNVLTRNNETLDVTRMSSLVDQIAALMKEGVEVILISSGAVASGRSSLCPLKKLDSVDQRQLFSAVGQAKLINRYYDLFQDHNILVGQILTTKESFSTRRHYLNQRNCMQVMLENGVLPIVNENDTVSVTELMFTDNDELSGMIASMMGVDALVILSNIDGVFDGPPSLPESKLIRKVERGRDLSDCIQTEKSGFGRGGMLTKSSIARKVADEGIVVFIANGRRDNILTDLIHTPDKVDCTCFIPSETLVPAVKKWVAHSDGFAKGELWVQEKAVEALRGPKAVSLLPVGIMSVVGTFEKDDIVKLLDSHGNAIGVGRVMAGADAIRSCMGKHGQKPVVHYDYLHLDFDK